MTGRLGGFENHSSNLPHRLLASKRESEQLVMLSLKKSPSSQQPITAQRKDALRDGILQNDLQESHCFSKPHKNCGVEEKGTGCPAESEVKNKELLHVVCDHSSAKNFNLLSIWRWKMKYYYRIEVNYLKDK